MTPSFALSLDTLSGWRTTLARRLDEVSRFLIDHELVDASAMVQMSALRERLGNEKLVVAFVAEFSRGKSELINCLLYTSPSPRDRTRSRMPSSA